MTQEMQVAECGHWGDARITPAESAIRIPHLPYEAAPSAFFSFFLPFASMKAIRV